MSALTTPRGDRIVYDDLGTPGAPTAVFIAGAGPTRADDPITLATGEAFAALGGRALIADRLGRGESISEGPIELTAQLDAIEALARDAEAPVILIGHSSGCAIAMLTASRLPELAGLVLWEAPLGLFEGGAPSWWARVRESIDAGDLEEAVARYMIGMPPEWLEELKKSPDYPGLIHSWIPDGEALAAVEESGYRNALAPVAAPVVALVGTETFPGMIATADALAEAAPDGRSEQLAGAWHSWEPQAMAERLARLAGMAL
ncbi:alpha/beta fold hydrolase [Microbacterium sp. MYb72]|uniref:alpha/beta fold hydrolase n=1 Tax=Microbacterium sp. MYb72 TaxID=1848693 RepID=UPI0015E3AC60|nr:alpha/beta fold hydrolase [Microbacterium sp. MYb72]